MLAGDAGKTVPIAPPAPPKAWIEALRARETALFEGQSEPLIAFRDIAPQAPVHLLVVPKTAEYATVAELADGDPALLAEVVATAKLLAETHADGHYRLVFNSGEAAGQTVFHVHLHVIPRYAGDPARDRLGQQWTPVHTPGDPERIAEVADRLG